MSTSRTPDTTSREVSYRKRLIEIAHALNSAASIQDILVEVKDKILDLVDADRVTIFALDTKNQELFSMFKAGSDVKEIRVPKTFGSIAGFTALSRKTINIRNAYDPSELGKLHPNLKFDARWDKTTGYRTQQVLACPIVFEKYLLGVLQLINKRGGTGFGPKDEEAAEELAKILGIAFYNQHRAARSSKPTKYGALIDKGVISEKDIEAAVTKARVNQVDVSKILMEDFKVPKEELGKAVAQFFNCKFWAPPEGYLMPDDIKGRLTIDFLKKNISAPIEKREGTLFVAVEDPYDLTRCDAIKAMNLSPRHEFLVALKDDIMGYLARSYGVGGNAGDAPVADETADLATIITELGSGEEGEIEGEEGAPGEAEAEETDTAIVKLANKIIIEAYNKGASDIHIEPYGKQVPTVIRFRIDGDCMKHLEVPPAHRNALVQRYKIMSKLDISERRKPQDGKIRFKKTPVYQSIKAKPLSSSATLVNIDNFQVSELLRTGQDVLTLDEFVDDLPPTETFNSRF